MPLLVFFTKGGRRRNRNSENLVRESPQSISFNNLHPAFAGGMVLHRYFKEIYTRSQAFGSPVVVFVGGFV